ncbi:shikimate dehydrogenase [Anderseniella sp. Alg231-50]|uniref:shikimate dehydrogenase n=1 Tax=Anderseniella sp. Alg231-50 TaxID=1922226 RepID=UPI000D55F7B7
MNPTTTNGVCILGHGITYSRSPMIHNYWIKKYGVDSRYGICDMPAEDLPDFLDAIRQGKSAGCNVTTPYKQAVIPFLDAIDDTASAIGSVNTIYRRDGQLRGTSTDGAGYVGHLKNIHPDLQLKGAEVLILGAGGAARAIADALLQSGCSVIYIANRTLQKAREIAAFQPDTIKPVAWDDVQSTAGLVDVLVNTTSLGMVGRQPLVFPLDGTRPGCVVSDIVYAPLETELLAQARRLGRPVLDGLGMLLHQAVPGFQLWFGIEPQVTGELRALIEQDLKSHG